MTTAELLARLREAGIRVPPSGLVRASVAALILDIAPRTLRQWRLDQVGPQPRRLHGAWYYDIADLAAYLTGQSGPG
jgi:hypothetical protein